MHLYFSKNVEQTFINGFIFTAKLRIGVTEKGYLTLELEVNGTPGHSSVPPKETAIGILSRAVSALEENPHPSMFGFGPEMDFFSYLSPSVSI